MPTRETVTVTFFGIDTGTEYTAAIVFVWVKPDWGFREIYGHWEVEEIKDENIRWQSDADEAGYDAACNVGVITDMAREGLKNE